MNELYVTKKKMNYENFVAWCPYCDFKNIFNRVTDLRTTEPIAFMKVKCLNDSCGKKFNINGDLVSPAFQMLVIDCYDLKKEKRYSYCILNLAQAFEVFFSLYLRVELLYKPFCINRKRREVEVCLNRMNELEKLLYKKIKSYTFSRLRNIFINRVLCNESIDSLNYSEPIINKLDLFKDVPSDEKIESVQNTRLSKLLIDLKNTKIGELRNHVVHKSAYRPSVEEVDKSIEETRSILFSLANCLGIKTDDINWYMKELP